MKANELGEGKRRRRKVRAAAYGPGPFGMYGTDAGYSGDAGIEEDNTDEKFQRIKEFVKFCIKKLGLKHTPRIRLSAKNDLPALGYFVPEENTIVVVYKNRHQMDIMRTLAHELVHQKQQQTRELDGSTGSPDENEANAMAGVLLRVWGQLYPEQFVEARKFTELEIAIMEGGGQVESDKVYYLKKQLEAKWNDTIEENFANMKFGKTKTMKVKEVVESATAGGTGSADIAIGVAYTNKTGKTAKNKDGTVKNALDTKGGNLITGGSIGKQRFIKR